MGYGIMIVCIVGGAVMGMAIGYLLGGRKVTALMAQQQANEEREQLLRKSYEELLEHEKVANSTLLKEKEHSTNDWLHKKNRLTNDSTSNKVNGKHESTSNKANGKHDSNNKKRKQKLCTNA